MNIDYSNTNIELNEFNKEIFRETNKLLNEFHDNCLVRNFIHDCNKKLKEIRIIPKMRPYYNIDRDIYSDKEILEFLFLFLPKFPIHLYKRYHIFRIKDGCYLIPFRIGDNKDIINMKFRDITLDKEKNKILESLFELGDRDETFSDF